MIHFIEEPDIALYSDSNYYENIKSKSSDLHIWDGLDYLNDDKAETKEYTRYGFFREYVLELKGMLPTSYDEAWNHPDGKFRERWRIGIQKELKSLAKVRKIKLLNVHRFQRAVVW